MSRHPFAEWGEARRGWSRATQRQYVQRARAAEEAIGDLHEADTVALYRYLDTLSPKAGARNHARAALVAWYDRQIELGQRTDNPAEDIEPRRRAKSDPKALTRRQASRLWAMARAHDDPKVTALVALMLFEAMRVGEVQALQWDDVSDERLNVTGKGGHQRSVRLHDVVADALERVPRDGPWVLGGQRPVTYGWCWRRVGELGRRCDVRLSPHVLRHTAATEMLRSGTDVRTVQRVLGHSSLATTSAYLRVADDAASAAIDGLEF